jgi:hypothetical protein
MKLQTEARAAAALVAQHSIKINQKEIEETQKQEELMAEARLRKDKIREDANADNLEFE